ncbi:MAG: GAF domain-containing protein [Vitreoscilla sp.]|nr:GAF domain-containing protein [Vitreoscilla sp.]
MKTFIRVAEVWVPSADGHVLELAGGLFDGAPAFGAISRTLCFGRAEGLPGRAWDEGRPVLLRQIEGSYFRRIAAARAAGLSAAVALPIFLGETLTSVVVLLCGDTELHVGAIELWRNDPRVGTDLTLADGYYGSTDPGLEALTRDGGLPRGAGVPGLAWQREASVFIANVAQSTHFLRAQEAAQAGIVRALALPCSVRGRETWVLSLLSSSATPIARRIESWLPDAGGAGLRRALAVSEPEGPVESTDTPAMPPDALGAIGVAWRTGVAQAVPGDGLLALPVNVDGVVAEVLALYV